MSKPRSSSKEKAEATKVYLGFVIPKELDARFRSWYREHGLSRSLAARLLLTRGVERAKSEKTPDFFRGLAD